MFRNILHAAPVLGSFDDALDEVLRHLLAKDPEDRADAAAVFSHPFFEPVDWTDAAARRLTPPPPPPLPPFVAVRGGALRFVGDLDAAPTKQRMLPTPKRVTFDEENVSPDAHRRSVRESYRRERAHRTSFRGFSYSANADLAASPRSYRASTVG